MTVGEHAAIIAATVVKLPCLLKQRMLATLTQEQLAVKAGIQRQTIGRLESGGDASVRTVRALADALGCTPAELYADQ